MPVGSSTVTLTVPQTPPDIGGTSQPFDNYQPALPVRYEISTVGVFPSPGSGADLSMIGRVMPFAGNFDPGGFVECAGQVLLIAQNTALFSILGTTYGGDGVTTFALPDLRSRDIIGASATDPIGAKVGQPTVSLADNQTPNFSNNPVQPFDNREPSLALNYLIATAGIFPVQGGGQDSATPLLGQIIAFAGNFAPKGWALANGQLLPINQNQALFSILGTTYGGNGITTFALPDLRDRAVIGSGNGFTVGALVGANFPTITTDQLPTKNWTGAVSTDWNTAGNWSPSGVPASTDDVTIGLVGGLNPTLASSTTVNTINIGGDAQLTLAGAATVLSVTNGITISGATTRIDGVGKLAANVTTSGTNDAPVIDANGGSLEITGLLSDPGNELTVGATQAGDLLLLDSGGHVNQVFFNSSTVELGGNLTVGSQMTINGTLQLDSGATLTDASGVTLNGGVITGAGTVTANVTATGAAIIRANGGTLYIVGDIIDSVDQLTLALTLDGDRLIHTAPNGPSHSSAHVANIDNAVGTLELSPNSDLTVATPMAIGNSTLQLDVASIAGVTVSASLADDSGVTINAGAITGAGTITAAVTATGAATITASGGIIQLNRPVVDSGNALSLDMAGDGDGFSVNGVAAAHSLSFNGHAGLVSLFPGADLTVAMPIDVGIGRVLLGEDSKLHNSAVSISSGTIQGLGLVDAAVTATGAALISATAGKLEFTGPIVDSGDALKLQIYNSLGELRLDAPTAAHTVEFFPFFSSGPGGIVTLTSQASLTVATQLAIADGTIALAGPNAVLTDANGATLNGGSIQGFGKVNAGLTGTGMIMASGGTLELQTAIGNSSGPVFQVANAASNILQVDGTVGTGNSFAFLGANGDLGLGTDAGFNNVVSGLNVGAAGAKTNLVDIEGHTVTIQTVTGGGTTSGVVTLSDGAVLQLTGLNSTAWFANTVSDGAGGTEIFVSDVCFCRGTLILTDEGEVAVEALAVGDRVRTLSGELKPIVWIGFGRDLVTRANCLARPIVVRRGALADDVPRRDLYLTHGHALHLEGVLIPVEHLVNHRSIVWDDTARVVEYYHIELADHDVVLAEGAPAESYYDASNWAQFLNTREGSQAGAKKPTYAPVLNGGDVVENAWARLCERAGGQIECDTTDDPDLHLVVDGERLDPVSVEDCVYTFALARPPAGTLVVRSRSAVPSLIGLNRHEHRQLGVAVRQIIVHRPGVMTSFDPDGPMFAEGGCHPAESGYSWTDGELHLPAPLFAHLKGALTLIIHTQKHAMRYPIAAALAKAA